MSSLAQTRRTFFSLSALLALAGCNSNPGLPIALRSETAVASTHARQLESRHAVSPATKAIYDLYAFGEGQTDGTNPWGGLLVVGHNLFGTTAGGGAATLGEVYELPAAGGTPTVLYSFKGNLASPPDGAAPKSVLVRDATGALYGTTAQGGEAAATERVAVRCSS